MKVLFSFTLILWLCSTISAQTVLKPADMKYDLSVTKATWESIHPGLYRYNTKQQIDNYFKEADARTNQSLPLRNFFVLLSQLNQKLHCGHSFVSYYNNKSAIRNEVYSKVFMPLLFKVIENKFVITHSLISGDEVSTGSEIVAINNIPVKRIIDSLLTVSKADGRNGRNKQLDNITIYPKEIGIKRYTLFDIYFPLFFKKDLNNLEYGVSIKQNGKIKNLIVKGLSKEEREKQFIAKYGNFPVDKQSWSTREINSNTLLFKLGDFATYNWKFDFNKYLDSIFSHIKAKGYKNLIMDIRENEGGADEARDAVLSYLTSKPIGCANSVRRLYRYTSIPDSLSPYLQTWDDDFKKPKQGYVKTVDGFYEKQPNSEGCAEITPRPNHFTGKIFLITDVTNSSATFIMADCVKRNKLGIVVGETTGGSQQGINGGEIIFLYLPKTGIEMDIPLIYQAPKEKKLDEGIKPDYIIPTTLKDIQTKKDHQLEFILNKIKQN